MTFDELKTELFDRGTNYLEEDASGIARAERWINQAYAEILTLQVWPFLEDNATGATPLTIPDLRRVRNVRIVGENDPLKFEDVMELRHEGWDLTTAGVPLFWYITAGNTINIAPTSADQISVDYYRRVPELTGSDVPVFDAQYHNIIVDKAMIKAYIDGDNFDAALALGAEVDKGLAAMTEDYMLYQREPSFIRLDDPYDG